MKRLLLILMILCTVFSFAACDVAGEMLEGVLPPEMHDTLFPDADSGDETPDIGTEDPGLDTEKPDDGNTPDQGDENPDNGDETPEAPVKAYNSFTKSEQNLFTQYIGVVIPFIPNNEYYVHGYYEESDYENGINFYTVGNTEEEYLAYLELYSDYELTETYLDDYGDTWYCYVKDDVVVDLSYYYDDYDDVYYVDVYVYSSLSEDGSDDNIPDSDYIYTDFTESEKALFNSYYGFVIPFIPNNEYYVDDLSVNEDGTKTLALEFYTIGNTEAEFEEYCKLFSIYEYSDVYTADNMVMYTYYEGDVEIYLSYFLYEGEYYVDVWLSVTVTGGNDNYYTYTDFTSTEKTLFNSYFGFVIPFIPNNDYSVEKYTYEDEIGINFYTFGNTQSEFNDYRTLLSSNYTFVESYKDSEGDTWYTYSKGGTYIELAFYEYYNNIFVIDVYVYELDGGNDDGGNNGGNTESNDDILTNNGAGLPSDQDGVYDVYFTDAEKVKDVTDQGYYQGGCPTTGSPAVLVIPVEFTDSRAASKGYTTDKLASAFAKGGKTDYYSVYDYYYISSYGKLTLDITVLDYWFCPEYSSTYYYNATYDYYGEDMAIGDQLILDEALSYLSAFMDLSKFDSDNNGIIDAVILVNTLDVDEEDFYWAYRYWNVYTDSYGYYYEYDGVSANDYVWASYQFLYETADENGETVYDPTVLNTYTFIHEFAHVLGLEDYYDTEYVSEPMGGLDVMDVMLGDHNAFSKFNLGWITTSRLVVTDSSVTLTLEAFCKGGDTIIIANNWDPTLGAYQEYYVIMYYTNEGLNAGDDAGYFVRDGIVVYHVNSSLCKEVYDGEIYYDVYNNNTDPSSSYGTEDNLIEYVKSAAGNYTYVEGDTLPTVTDDDGNALSYTFVVDSISSDYATITFSVC